MEPEWKGNSGPFETISREVAWAESRTGTFTVIGKYDDLERREIKPGDLLSSVPGLDSPSGNWCVRTTSLSRDEGNAGTLTVTAVRVMQLNNGYKYNEIWQVSMDAVEKKLISHPSVKGYQDIVQKWEETPAAYKYGKDGKTFFYVTGKMNGMVPETKEITEEAVIKYCQASLAGISSYNEYLPVITKTTYYLRAPGLNYDKDNVASGTIKFDGKKAGEIDEPDVKVSGYTGGMWLKSMDTLTENADGTCNRTEQWTYTRDTTHKWIYEDLGSK